MAGLFGWNFTGTVKNLTLTNVTIGGSNAIDAGAVVAQMGATSAGTVTNVSVVGGTVSATSAAGGLVGVNGAGTISNSSAIDVSVSQSFTNMSGIRAVGGLVGENDGTITQSYATGSVTAAKQAGGLVGYNTGTISKSYATGAVTLAPISATASGTSMGAGGFVGVNVVNPSSSAASITQSYATGLVTLSSANSANIPIGSFVGANGGTINEAYGTGYLSVAAGTGTLGGFAGAGTAVNAASVTKTGSLTDTYYDSSTTGQSGGSTTATLQGTLPSGFNTVSSSVWATASGLYPYFSWQYASTPQAITGTAYSDSGVTALKGGAVTVFVAGSSLDTASTGANGYYYILAPSGTISGGGSAALAYVSSGGTGARAYTLTGTTSGFDLWGGTLIAPTSNSTYSTASATTLQTQDSALILAATNHDAASTDAAWALSKYCYIATGAFAVDQNLTFTGGDGLYIKSLSGDITVSNAVSLANGSLVLDAYANIAIDAPVTISGTSPVTLTTNDGGSGGSVNFGLLDLGSTGKLSFTGTEGAGQSLTINSTSYDLIYTAVELQAINASSSSLTQTQPYAIANTIDLSGISNFVSIGSNSQAFTGTLDGLNNTITGLTQLDPTGYAGLFGFTQGATLRNINLANISITVTGTSAVPADVGGLVGSANRTSGDQGTSLANITALGAISVSGTHSNMLIGGVAGLLELNGTGTNLASSVVINVTSTDVANTLDVGGLVGSNSGTISNSFATGSVMGPAVVGGFTGLNDGTITQSYATGAVSLNNPSATAGSSNTISGSITLFAGGFVGVNGARGGNPGTISQSYATGSVSVNVGSSRPSQLTITTEGGGFAGGNTRRFTGDSINGGTLNEVYATGYVSGATANGGLVGMNSNAFTGEIDGTITNSYWDTETTGQTTVSGDSGASTTGGMTTAALQGTLPSGFNTVSSGVWNTGTGLFPYLGWRYTSTPQAISGTAYAASGALLKAGSITAVVGGTALDTASTGGNGYYYLLSPSGTISGGGSAVIAYIVGGSGGARANTVTGTTTGFDLMGSLLIAPTVDTTYSTASATTLQVQDASLISAAEGSNSAATTAVSALSHYGYIASGAFTVDQAVTMTGGYGLYIKTLGGDITVSNALSLVDGGLLLDSYASLNIAANLTISGSGNAVLTTSDGGSGDYIFFDGKSLQFTGTEGSGQGLTINGTSYSLLYTMAEAQAINTSNTTLDGNYALAKSLDAATTSNWISIGTNGAGTRTNTNGFAGIFEGLGNTVSNLAITSAAEFTGFFGGSSGTIRDFGIVGGSVTVTGTSNGDAGGLVGDNHGTIKYSYSSAAVTIAGSGAGGLVGLNATGTILDSFATGNVSAGSNAGGLVGVSNGTMTNVYATGSAQSANQFAGALIAQMTGGSITNAYGTGAVSGTGSVGGAIGTGSGTVTNVYWDTSTTGQGSSAGGTGETTANLQAGPTGLDASPWLMASSVYPYLNFQTSPVPQTTVSGTVYSDYGVTALGNANVIEAFLSGGSVIATGTSDPTTGAYSVTGPGTSGTLLLFLDNSNGKFADTVVSYTGSSLTGVNLYAGYLNFINTSAVSVSSVLSSLSSFAAPTGGYSANDFLFTVSGSTVTPTNGLSVSSTGAFTVDQALTLAGTDGLAITTAAGDITLSDAVSLAAGNLMLNSAGAIAVNAPVTISGAGKVALTAANDTTTFAGKSLLELTFGVGDNISFGATNNGGTLSINGTAYTLLYSLTDVQNINSSLAGKFALATSLDGSTTSSWTPIGTFTGVFDGLGNTISNLTYTSAATNTGLFGFLTGTVRNIGLVGGTVTGSHTSNLGSLVGTDQGLVYNAYSSASVSGTQGENGGLIGYINSAGAAANVFATGKVSGGSGGDAGGLAGELSGQLTNAFFTGSVTGSYAGGLVSLLCTTGKLTNGYSTGYVHGTNTSGGLVSNLFGSGTITNGYWDTATSGVSATHGVSNVTNASGVTGLATSDFQTSLPSGLSTSAWSMSSVIQSYPYLKSFFPNGVDVISGTAYSDHTGTTALVANNVGALVNGTSLGYAYTGANGYYYDFLPAGTLASGSQILVYLSGNTTKGDTLFRNGGGSIFPTYDIYGGYLWLSSSAASMSDYGTSLATAVGSNSGSDFLFTLSGNVISLKSGTNLEVVGTGNFSIDQAINTTGTVYLNMGGLTTQTAPITAAGLALQGSSAAYTLTNTSNSVQTLADRPSNNHTLTFVNSGALTIGTIGSDVGIAGFTSVSITAGGNLTVAASVGSTGTTTLNATGNLTINSGKTVTGTGGVVLSATGNFVNNAGSSAVSSSGGRWLIYSANPTNDTFGNLDSANTAVWNGTYATLSPDLVTATGNRYVFANQPTLTFTSTDLTKIYGTDGGTAVATAYTVSGLDAGVAHAYLADTAAAVYSGTPSLSSDGAATTATVAGDPYAINISQGSVEVGDRYAVSFASTGTFTVNPATVTITYGVANATSTYGTLATLGAVTLTGVKTEDASNVTGVLSLYDSGNNAATLSATLKVGAYTEKVTSLTGLRRKQLRDRRYRQYQWHADDRSEGPDHFADRHDEQDL